MHLIRCSYVLNKQVSKYVVKSLVSNNTSIVLFVLTGYGFMLPCMHFVHLTLPNHSMPAMQGAARALYGAEKPRIR